MAEAIRIPAAEAREKTKAGKVPLVCAYPDEARCKGIKLEGAMDFQEFQSKLPSLDKNQEIIFYCA